MNYTSNVKKKSCETINKLGSQLKEDHIAITCHEERHEFECKWWTVIIRLSSYTSL